MWLRSALPKHHLDAESKDTVKLGIGLIATMTALILGLVTASAKSSFDAVDNASARRQFSCSRSIGPSHGTGRKRGRSASS